MAVSMQSPISSYGDFGKVASDSLNKTRQRESDEKKLKWQIESNEIMQLRDLHENARQFDITHELKRDYFDVHKDVTLSDLAMREDQYWNHVEDMNHITLESASMNWENAKASEVEQKHILSQVVPNIEELKTKLNDLNKVYLKDYEETEQFGAGTKWYHGGQQIQDAMGSWAPGLTTDEMVKRNLENVDAQHKINIQNLLSEYNIDSNELSFDFANADAATLMESLTLGDLLTSNVMGGGPMGQSFVNKYNNAGLTNQTYSVLNNINLTQVQNAENNLTSLGDLISEGYQGQKLSPTEYGNLLMTIPSPNAVPQNIGDYNYQSTNTYQHNPYQPQSYSHDKVGG